MSSYINGDTIRLSATFTVDGAATDPTTVTLRVKAPSGTVTAYTHADAEIARVSDGVYRKDVPFDAAGSWYVRWEGTGAAAGVEETAIVVSRSKVV